MSFVTPMQSSFNGGELSPLELARNDNERWKICLKEMTGYLPLLSGAAEAAPGTWFVASEPGPFRCIPYEFIETQAYMIAARDLAMRFYTNNVQIESAPGIPYEVVTPWTYAQVLELDRHQSQDVLYLTHGDVPPQALSRTSADTFALTALECRNGPFEARNPDKSLTVSASATTGSVTLTASSALFALGDVGGLMELEFGGLSDIPMWEPGIAVTAGIIRQWDGNVYQMTGGAARTGSVAPTHVEGAEWDGMGAGTDINDKGPYGVQWTYLYNRYGQVKITGYTSPTQVTVLVQKRLASTASVWRWRFGAFSPRRGYPSCVAVWNNRLIFSKDATIYATAVNGFGPDHADFERLNEFGEATRDEGFFDTLPKPHFIRWMESGDVLEVGTSRGEHVVRPASASAGVGPGNVAVTTATEFGAAPGQVVRADGNSLFVSRSRTKLLQFGVSTAREGYDTPDLTRFADQMGNAGLTEICWACEPHRHLWASADDGALRCLLYVPQEAALGWARRPMAAGLAARSVAVIPDPDGRFDDVWIAGQSGGSWAMLRMDRVRLSSEADLNACMVDMAVRYEGVPTAAISAPHLAGQTVQIVADGKVHPAITLDGAGDGELRYAASMITFGLGFEATALTLPQEAGSDNGTGQTKITRIEQLHLRVHNSDGIVVAVQGLPEKMIELQKGDSLMDTAFDLYTGDHQIETGGAYDRKGQIRFGRYLPKPQTILGLIAHVSKGNG